MTMLWDIAQVGLNCCGINGINNLTTDFNQNQVLKDHRNITMPMSCCKFNETSNEMLWKNIIAGNLGDTLHTDGCRGNDNFYHDKGCFEQLREYFKEDYFDQIVGSFVAVLAFEILAIAFAGFIRV